MGIWHRRMGVGFARKSISPSFMRPLGSLKTKNSLILVFWIPFSPNDIKHTHLKVLILPVLQLVKDTIFV